VSRCRVGDTATSSAARPAWPASPTENPCHSTAPSAPRPGDGIGVHTGRETTARSQPSASTRQNPSECEVARGQAGWCHPLAPQGIRAGAGRWAGENFGPDTPTRTGGIGGWRHVAEAIMASASVVEAPVTTSSALTRRILSTPSSTETAAVRTRRPGGSLRRSCRVGTNPCAQRRSAALPAKR